MPSTIKEVAPVLQDDMVIYDNGEYFVEIGLPVKSPILGFVYRIVNKKYLVVEEESPSEPKAIILADKLKQMKELVRSVEYEAALIPHNRKH